MTSVVIHDVSLLLSSLSQAAFSFIYEIPSIIALLGIGVTASPCFLWEGFLMEKVKKHTVQKCPRFTQSELQQEYN